LRLRLRRGGLGFGVRCCCCGCGCSRGWSRGGRRCATTAVDYFVGVVGIAGVRGGGGDGGGRVVWGVGVVSFARFGGILRGVGRGGVG
jgi:hypothetical protein